MNNLCTNCLKSYAQKRLYPTARINDVDGLFVQVSVHGHLEVCMSCDSLKRFNVGSCACRVSKTNREGYREYKSRSYVCKNGPTIHKCTHSRNCEKVVTQHVWNDYIELAEDARYTPYYKALYKKRKEKNERAFADAKEKHAMRYTPFHALLRFPTGSGLSLLL